MKLTFLIFCCLISSITSFSQDNGEIPKTAIDMPVSLLSNWMPEQLQITVDKSTYVDIWMIKDFKFRIIDQESIRNGFFRFDLRNIGRTASRFSYESYKDVDLYRHFPIIPDITTLHRFNNIGVFRTH